VHFNVFRPAVRLEPRYQDGTFLESYPHLPQARLNLLKVLVAEGQGGVLRNYGKDVVEVVRQPSRHNRKFFDAPESFYRFPELDLLRLIGNEDQHSAKAHDGEGVSRDVKPLDVAIWSSNTEFMGLHLLARESPRDRAVSRKNPSTLPVVQLVTAAPLGYRKVICCPKHFASGLVGEDESMLIVNDGNCHAYLVQHSLNETCRLKP
jgi:hypothetical protein